MGVNSCGMGSNPPITKNLYSKYHHKEVEFSYFTSTHLPESHNGYTHNNNLTNNYKLQNINYKL